MATVKTRKVETVYELTLSQAEAQVLRNILHKVGGSPDGARRYAEDVKDALQNAGVTPDDGSSIGNGQIVLY